MSINEFNRPISTDVAPYGSVCEWCDKPAEHQLTVVGGSRHNTEGFFCRPCGEEFVQAVLPTTPDNRATVCTLKYQ